MFKLKCHFLSLNAPFQHHCPYCCPHRYPHCFPHCFGYGALLFRFAAPPAAISLETMVLLYFSMLQVELHWLGQALADRLWPVHYHRPHSVSLHTTGINLWKKLPVKMYVQLYKRHSVHLWLCEANVFIAITHCLFEILWPSGNVSSSNCSWHRLTGKCQVPHQSHWFVSPRLSLGIARVSLFKAS